MGREHSFNIAAWLNLARFTCFLAIAILLQFYSEVKPSIYYWDSFQPYVIGIFGIGTSILIALKLNWVRIYHLLSFVAGIIISVIYPFNYGEIFEISILVAILQVLSRILEILALYFMFNKASNQFIRDKRAKKLAI